MNPNVTIGPITLHLVAEAEPYEKYPKVGIVARATITVSADPDDCSTAPISLEVQSRGVWDIECPDLVAGWPIPEGSWVIGDYGSDQVDQVRWAIRALLPDNPIPTPTEED